MPRIFDNIEQSLLPALRQTLEVADRADFCVGYFNLRGWKNLDALVERWSGGEGHCCRLLIGMPKLPQEELREAMAGANSGLEMDNQTALRLKMRLAEEFRQQLMIGAPNNQDEVGLRRLAAQLRAKKVMVKLSAAERLHAKLYLLFRPDPVNPSVGFVGSSNLTLAGLSHQGELNVDVMDHDACQKLARWFEDRWKYRWCIDISAELIKVIDESWAREQLIPPYHIYVNHLSQEAQAMARLAGKTGATKKHLTLHQPKCTFMYMATRSFLPITEALKKAIAEGGLSFKKLEQETGVTRQIIMGLVKDQRVIGIDSADKLAAFFGLELVKRKGR